jgi:hypothetical protein
MPFLSPVLFYRGPGAAASFEQDSGREDAMIGDMDTVHITEAGRASACEQEALCSSGTGPEAVFHDPARILTFVDDMVFEILLAHPKRPHGGGKPNLNGIIRHER